jgi:hypothetical protein
MRILPPLAIADFHGFQRWRRLLVVTLLTTAVLLLVNLEAAATSQSTVHLIPLNTANWSGNAGFGAGAPRWYADNSSIVHLQGAAKQTSSSGSSALLIGTLPTAARPARNVFTIVINGFTSYSDLAINTKGQILVIPAASPQPPSDLQFVSLEGVSYQPATKLRVTPISLNTVNWSGKAGFGSSAPGWYTDRSGVVHLQGAARQYTAAGTIANLVGTLPAAVRPSRTVYTIVHTFGGTYADLAINPKGQILEIGESPGASNLSFLSLEGVTFQRAGMLHVTPIALNTSCWSGNAGFGSGAPGWYKDGSGIIHLQGAVKGATSSCPITVGTLPPAARPAARVVWTIAHAFAGTYALITIGSDGSVDVNTSHGDNTFISLEGINYGLCC